MTLGMIGYEGETQKKPVLLRQSIQLALGVWGRGGEGLLFAIVNEQVTNMLELTLAASFTLRGSVGLFVIVKWPLAEVALLNMKFEA